MRRFVCLPPFTSDAVFNPLVSSSISFDFLSLLFSRGFRFSSLVVFFVCLFFLCVVVGGGGGGSELDATKDPSQFFYFIFFVIPPPHPITMETKDERRCRGSPELSGGRPDLASLPPSSPPAPESPKKKNRSRGLGVRRPRPRRVLTAADLHFKNRLFFETEKNKPTRSPEPEVYIFSIGSVVNNR